MTFGYALLGALVLLLPGFAGYYGMRLGETGNLVSPRPDRPNSNLTIFLIVLLALSSHAAGASLFAVNEKLVEWHWTIMSLGFDPSPYRMLWSGRVPSGMSDTSFCYELVYFVLLTAGAGWVCERISGWQPLTTTSAPLRFGWLLPAARQVERGSHVVLGYVQTTTGHNGAWFAYQGIVRRLTLNDDDAIEMIVLEQCDRFVVRIVDGKVERVDSDQQTIELVQLRNNQVASYELEMIEVFAPISSMDVDPA